MQAIRFSDYGGPEVLHLTDVEEPHAGPKQVRVAVRASAVNPADYKLRAGMMRDFRPVNFPAGLGAEASGIVDEVGEGVTDVAVGDAVFGMGKHTYAEYAVLTSWVKKPRAMSFHEAAAIGTAAETAVRMLDLIGVKAGETLLISGAAGGVGTATVQLARRRGVTVIGTATAQKHDYLRSIGAIPTTYGPGLAERVRALAPKGVHAALDVAGSGVIPELIELTGNPSKVLTIAISQANQGTLSTFAFSDHPEKAMAEAARAFEDGQFRMRVDRVFPLADAAKAHEASASKHTTGKLVLAISDG